MPFSRSSNARQFGWLRRVPIAHRGLHDRRRGVPENSLAAFAAAARRGFAIELDVHLSRDGTAMVFHDDTLMRLTGNSGRLADKSAAELGTMALYGTGQTIPTLKQVLDLVGGRVGILVELKTERSVDFRLEQAVSDLLRTYRGRVAVQSFNPRTVAWFARHHTGLPRGQLSWNFRQGRSRMTWGERRRLAMLALLGRSKADFIGYHVKAMPDLVLRYWRRLGVPVIAWTVRSPADLARARAESDNIIFEGVTP